jgi:hypothetical protein
MSLAACAERLRAVAETVRASGDAAGATSLIMLTCQPAAGRRAPCQSARACCDRQAGGSSAGASGKRALARRPQDSHLAHHVAGPQVRTLVPEARLAKAREQAEERQLGELDALLRVAQQQLAALEAESQAVAAENKAQEAQVRSATPYAACPNQRAGLRHVAERWPAGQVSKEAKKQAREQNAARQAHLRNLEEQRDDLRRQAEAPRPAASAGDSERVTAKKRKLAEHREAVAALEQKRNEVSGACCCTDDISTPLADAPGAARAAERRQAGAHRRAEERQGQGSRERCGARANAAPAVPRAQPARVDAGDARVVKLRAELAALDAELQQYPASAGDIGARAPARSLSPSPHCAR